MSGAVDRGRVFGERPEAVERIAPGFFRPDMEAEHLARYRWASRWVRGRVVLDVACGTGYGAPLLRAAGARNVLSLDVSADALEFGKPRYDLQAVRADAHCIPVATASMDAVVSLETIEHLSDPLGFISEVVRMLNSGGDLLVSTPNAARSAGTNPYHLHEQTLDEIQGMIEGAGLGVTGVWGQHWGPTKSWWPSVKGIRRILHEIERAAAVLRLVPGFKPQYWCVRATKR